ncbi:MAG: hypothetical protein ACNA8S_03035 [Deferrisomatales bacterium]
MRRADAALGAALLVCAFGVSLAAGCSREPGEVPLSVPRGYVPRLELSFEGHQYGFGPFVGYYFRPDDPADLTRLRFVCYNERGFYASDAPVNALLYEGEAVLARLPEGPQALLRGPGDRIEPLFFDEAPPEWLATRPEPQEEFVHFHSAYDAVGPALVGYWLRHVAVRGFTYDMGGRVGPGGPLYHAVPPGPDLEFPRIIEFDRGP